MCAHCIGFALCLATGECWEMCLFDRLPILYFLLHTHMPQGQTGNVLWYFLLCALFHTVTHRDKNCWKPASASIFVCVFWSLYPPEAVMSNGERERTFEKPESTTIMADTLMWFIYVKKLQLIVHTFHSARFSYSICANQPWRTIFTFLPIWLSPSRYYR